MNFVEEKTDQSDSPDLENYRLLHQLRENCAMQEASFSLSDKKQFKEYQEVMAQLMFFRCPYQHVHVQGMVFVFFQKSAADFIDTPFQRSRVENVLNQEQEQEQK